MTNPSGAMPERLWANPQTPEDAGPLWHETDFWGGTEYIRVDLATPTPDALRKVREIILAASDTIAAFEPVLPTKKLHDHGRWTRSQIKDALALLDGRYPVPEGYVLVKREPTPTMRQAGKQTLFDEGEDWRARGARLRAVNLTMLLKYILFMARALLSLPKSHYGQGSAVSSPALRHPAGMGI